MYLDGNEWPQLNNYKWPQLNNYKWPWLNKYKWPQLNTYKWPWPQLLVGWPWPQLTWTRLLLSCTARGAAVGDACGCHGVRIGIYFGTGASSTESVVASFANVAPEVVGRHRHDEFSQLEAVLLQDGRDPVDRLGLRARLEHPEPAGQVAPVKVLQPLLHLATEEAELPLQLLHVL